MREELVIREYQTKDLEEIGKLFYDTVHVINKRDYTSEQLDAWTGSCIEFAQWDQSFLKNYSLIAVKQGKLVGFGDIDKSNYLNRLYVHKEYQREGIASKICDGLEAQVKAGEITVHASITAKPFFEKRGYRVQLEQEVERKGITLTNYIMKKALAY